MEPERDTNRGSPSVADACDGGEAQEAQPEQADPIESAVLPIDPAWMDLVDDAAFDPDGAGVGSPGSAVDPSVFRPRPRTRPFRADVHLTELDDRARPGPTWPGRAEGLSGSNVVIDSRRMCYVGRRVLIAVHMIDDAPAPLAGRVHSCDYLGAGLYRLDLNLERFPDDTLARLWLSEQGR